jgi:hypothetical protein
MAWNDGIFMIDGSFWHGFGSEYPIPSSLLYVLFRDFYCCILPLWWPLCFTSILCIYAGIACILYCIISFCPIISYDLIASASKIYVR